MFSVASKALNIMAATVPSAWPVRQERRHAAAANANARIENTLAEILDKITNMEFRLAQLEESTGGRAWKPPPGLETPEVASQSTTAEDFVNYEDLMKVEKRLDTLVDLLLMAPLPHFEKINCRLAGEDDKKKSEKGDDSKNNATKNAGKSKLPDGNIASSSNGAEVDEKAGEDGKKKFEKGDDSKIDASKDAGKSKLPDNTITKAPKPNETKEDEKVGEDGEKKLEKGVSLFGDEAFNQWMIRMSTKMSEINATLKDMGESLTSKNDVSKDASKSKLPENCQMAPKLPSRMEQRKTRRLTKTAKMLEKEDDSKNDASKLPNG